MNKTTPRLSLAPNTTSQSALKGERIVACDCEVFFGPNGPLPRTDILHISLDALDAAFLAAVAPGLVVLPLIAASHDAAAAVELLEALGYRGRITVLAPALPRPGLVERELRALGPGARLTLISP